MSAAEGRPARIQRKLLLAFSVPLVFSFLVSATSTLYLVDRLLIRQAQAKVAADLRSAHEIYQGRLERLRDFVRFGASLHAVRQALETGDTPALLAELQTLRVRQGADVLTVTDPRGRVVARARNPQARGDSIAHLAPVRRALVGEETSSTERLAEADLKAEGEDLVRQARLAVVPTPHALPETQDTLAAGMVQAAAAPILGSRGGIAGALFAARLLNRDDLLVDKIRSTVFTDVTYEGRPTGTATLFLDDVRVATNVPAAGGGRALGTRLSAEVAGQVLERRQHWAERAFVVSDWYLSAYEPLLNCDDQVVGSLYVGVLERPYRGLMWRSLGVVGAIHLLGGLGVLVLAATLSRSLSRPIATLARGARRVAAGDLGHAIPVASNDEIGELAREFNDMTRALRERDQEIEGLTQGLEQKVQERSAELERRNEELLRTRGELLEMMEKQKRTNQELTTLVERLRTTQDELVRSGKLAALGALAAGVAHEINNPLAVIQGNVELLQLRAGADPESWEEVGLIARQTKRMQGIVSKLLTFARQDASDAKPLDLEALVREALELAAAQARNARVAVETHFAPDLPPVVADGPRLVQVFTNLVVNALQAMPDGGRLRVASGLADEGAGVCVSFTDTGPGIPKAESERVWNPFYTTKPSGTGLGLSISHAIVEEHGGRILLESPPGRGTTFTVVLPRDA